MRSHKHHLRTLLALVLAISVLAGCGQPAKPTATPTPAPKLPTEVKIAFVTNTTVEEPWNMMFINALDTLVKERPHGVDVKYEFTESVFGEDYEVVMRNYAERGFDAIWVGGAGDYVERIMNDYPNVLFYQTGAGCKALGKNAPWDMIYNHEPAYLCGMIAGLMTKSNVVGVVAAMPAEEVNDTVNGYYTGVKAANPKAKVKITFIESWYDPPKAKEATLAQIAAGADWIYAERYGVFEALQEKGLHGFGNQADQHDMAPGVVVSSGGISALGSAKRIVDLWWEHATTGKPYDFSKDREWANMAQGGSFLAPFYQHEGTTLPKDVVDKINQAKAAILNGTLVIPVDESTRASD